PLAELVRPQPVRPIFEPPPPPYIPGPPVAPKLKPLRTGLRDVIAKRDEAKAGVADKAELVPRAEAALAQSNRILSEVVATKQRRAEALEHSIRNGSASAPVQDNDAIVVTRERARRDVEAAESVVAKFQEELRTARQTLGDRNG